MRSSSEPPGVSRPATWAVVVALVTVYLTWGTTYLAIRGGVQTWPPMLFSGPRLLLAGLILFGYVIVRGERIWPSWSGFGRLAIGGSIMFVGGNGLITIALMRTDSSLAAVLVATTPLWLGLLETTLPWGDRLPLRGWIGLLAGLVGVLILLAPRLGSPELFTDWGPWCVLGSAFCWAVGSFALKVEVRSSPGRNGTVEPGLRSPFAAAAWQMCLGGSLLSLIGLALGEHHMISRETISPQAVFWFVYLLIVGSLMGFVAYTWLLANVSTTLAGTYAYVNPVVAILVGWLFADEPITVQIIAGMLVILVGVALVKSSLGRPKAAPSVHLAPGRRKRPAALAGSLSWAHHEEPRTEEPSLE